MQETRRKPVPRVDTGELDTARAFLTFQRHAGHADVLREQIDGTAGR
ncbi:hypothetical protein SK571_05925 [Lentzea sp. BCCO 10_0798]|uniref:DUF664 domain-containing protein n=1 Tax=Lentzea kristufekii TaxID=3095430 RepID=A0ABU4TKU3_9PSEU|nr:hypothetical protein [Lentzea sp. BCCO 10_0798]MDX8048909.1 hypothetical protein [Lentzea sp. BCCO 10_0798]